MTFLGNPLKQRQNTKGKINIKKQTYGKEFYVCQVTNAAEEGKVIKSNRNSKECFLSIKA